MHELMVAYHNEFRFFVGYPKRCSTSGMLEKNNVPSMGALIRKYIFNFTGKVNSSTNEIIMNINQSDLTLSVAQGSRLLRLFYMACMLVSASLL